MTSTLLPQNDFHPATIQRVNASMSRDCASKPNVFLAPHSTLDLNSLYDQVHLYKAAVPTFARTLKDIALKCSPNTSHRSNRSIDTQHRPARHSPRPRPHSYTSPSQWHVPNAQQALLTLTGQTTQPTTLDTLWNTKHNYDNITNKDGSQLLQLCRTLGMYIVNGRLRGDSYGRYTYSSSLGSSTVDN